MLKKELEFLEPFSTAMGSISFNNFNTKVKCFCVDSNTGLEAGKNVTILFYNSEDDFVIRLKTKEGKEQPYFALKVDDISVLVSDTLNESI